MRSFSPYSLQPFLRSIVFFAVLFSFLSFSTSASAQGDLLITPKRVVFEGSTRSFDVSLANTGKDSATYVISFIQIRMTENGTFETIETPDPGQRFAEPFLRIFPRQVTLAPNEAQTVKVQVRKSNEMQPGEYRSHLYFRAVPKEHPLGSKEAKADSSLSVRLTPIYGISIPVIIKVGAPDAQVQISDFALQVDKEAPPVAKLSFNRSGNMSVYGDIAVNHISRQGKVTKVGMAKGFAVYTPNTVRHFNLPLDKDAKVDYRTGKLQVIYTDNATKPMVIAEKEIVLQQQ